MREKIFLQCIVTLACLVPIGAGLYGIIHGVADDRDIDSHFRYLSGLLLGIGLAFLSAVPNIETHKRRFFLLTMIVFIGGLGRLYGAYAHGWPSHVMIFGLIMELIITPLICIWQHHVARKL